VRRHPRAGSYDPVSVPLVTTDFGSISNIGTGAALTDPGGSTTNGTPLVMAPGNGDQSYPWRVSFHPYPQAG
jgi:hypothetical protein